MTDKDPPSGGYEEENDYYRTPRQADSGTGSDRVFIAGVEAAVAAGMSDSEVDDDLLYGDYADPEFSPPGAGLVQAHDELQDWTDPPTGQVPRVLLEGFGDEPAPTDPSLANVRGPVWREHGSDWDDSADDLSHLSGDGESLITATGGSVDDEDPFEFDFAPAGSRVTGEVSVEDVRRELAEAEVPVYGPAIPTVAADPAADAEEQREVAWRSWSGSVPATSGPGDDEVDLGDGRLAGRRHAARRVAGRTTRPLDPERVSAGRSRRAGQARTAPEPEPEDAVIAGRASTGGRDLPIAIVTGLAICAVAIIAFVLGSVASLVLVTIVLTAAAAEFFGALRRAGHRPATLLVLVAVPALVIVSYLKGPAAAWVVVPAFLMLAMVWFVLGVSRGDPFANLGATLVGFTWIGVLGSFAGALRAPASFPHGNGVALLVGAIVPTVAYDVAAFGVGAKLGRHKLAPSVSPGKSWEGLIAGAVAAILVSVIIVARISPWHDSSAVALGLVIAIAAPFGDLCESLFKRSLGLKDMGSLLPAHGGILDRVDGLLFALPAVYLFVRAVHIA